MFEIQQRVRNVLRATRRDRLGIPRDRFLLSTICRLVDKKGVDFLINLTNDGWFRD